MDINVYEYDLRKYTSWIHKWHRNEEKYGAQRKEEQQAQERAGLETKMSEELKMMNLRKG
jgi:hypothetical protein